MVRMTRIGRFCLLIVFCVAGVANAATITPALKTQYRYFTTTQFNYGVNLGCFSGESEVTAAMLQLAGNPSTGKCGLLFDHWVAPWPNSKGLTDTYDICPPPKAVPYVSGWAHLERRGADYSYNVPPNCSITPGPFHDGFEADRQFYYYCPESYHLINFVAGAEPFCALNAGATDPNKTQKCEHCVGDPISTGTGYLLEHEIDYPGVPNTGLKFDRYYRGRTWHHSYERYVTYADAGGGVSYASVSRPDGGLYTFQRSTASRASAARSHAPTPTMAPATPSPPAPPRIPTTIAGA